MKKAVKNTSSPPLYSMTGFASAPLQTSRAGKKNGTRLSYAGGTHAEWVLEIRSVNHRFFELKIRLAKELYGLDQEIRTFVEKELNVSGVKRGAVEVSFHRGGLYGKNANAGTSELMSLDMEACERRWEEFLRLKKKLKIKAHPLFSDLVHTPGLFNTSPYAFDGDELLKQFFKDFVSLKQRWIEMKAKEGETLRTLLSQQIQLIENHLSIIQKEKQRWVLNQKTKLQEKLSLLFSQWETSSQAIDITHSLQTVLQSRVSQELQVAVERADIQEELDRFASHLTQLRQLLANGGSIGRKLDFLLQELNREINTLSNKAQDATISQNAVEIKVILEQVREQSMNIE